MLIDQDQNTYSAPVNFVKALRKRRKALDLPMQNVADAAGSVGFISQLVRGIAALSLASLVSLAEVLKSGISHFQQQPAWSSQSTHIVSRHAYSVAGADVSFHLEPYRKDCFDFMVWDYGCLWQSHTTHSQKW